MRVKRIDLALGNPVCISHATVYKTGKPKTFFKSLTAFLPIISSEGDRKQKSDSI